MSRAAAIVLFCVLALPRFAAAEGDVHAGLRMRTAVGTHQCRLEFGARPPDS
jgi:hypothetical protein